MSESVSLTGVTGVRCSDADRERISARLREAAADGRLTMDELEDRLGGVYAAKHHHELDVFVADLPGTDRPRAAAGWLAVLAAARTQLRLDLALMFGRAGTGWPRRRIAVAVLVTSVLIASAGGGFDFD
jgi:hypothetical protein